MDPTIEVTAVDAPVATLGECPVWSASERALYWVDIDERTIHRHDWDTGAHERHVLGGRPGSIVKSQRDANLVVAVEHELVELDWATGETSKLLQLEAPNTGNRLNDGRCDPFGRFVVGSMFADTTAGKTTGVLYRVGLHGTARLRSGIGVTNGLAFDLERGLMYFADTPTDRVLVFDYDVESGEATNEQVFFDYAEVPGKPDGACVDADGCYWSASVYGWALLRITPDGRIDRRVELPLQKPSMPCFGGPDLNVLFVTTIGSGGNTPSEPGRDGFVPGTTLRIDGLGVTGVDEPAFSGLAT